MHTETIDGAVLDFVAALRVLIRRLRTAGGVQGLSWAQTTVMARLENDGPATTADLARAEGMKPQSMGETVLALEEAGIVRRTAHPTDGRQMLVELTLEGTHMRKTSLDAKVTWLAQAVGHLDQNDQATLFATTDIIQRLAEF